jgi:hypothetical protein
MLTGLLMRASFLSQKKAGLGNSPGQTGPTMKAAGSKIELRGMVSTFMPMGGFLRGNGLKIT